MTRRQRIIAALIDFHWKYIKQNLSTLDFVRMQKQENTIKHLKNKFMSSVRKLYEDKEYWEAVIKELTPFEQSNLVSAIADTMLVELTVQLDEIDMENFADRLTSRNLIRLIESLAMRKDIVEHLQEVDKSEWCADGRKVMSRLLRKRKEFMDIVQLKLPTGRGASST